MYDFNLGERVFKISLKVLNLTFPAYTLEYVWVILIKRFKLNNLLLSPPPAGERVGISVWAWRRGVRDASFLHNPAKVSNIPIAQSSIFPLWSDPVPSPPQQHTDPPAEKIQIHPDIRCGESGLPHRRVKGAGGESWMWRQIGK